MKLKRLPEDFQVDEQSQVRPAGGRYALYRLTKRSLGTPEAVAAVARRLGICSRRISFGGLKDKHAVTTQYVTIDRGPRRPVRQSRLELEYLGQIDRAFRSTDVAANRFTITVRDLDRETAARLCENGEAVRRDGVPNYFDQQRFGSLGQSGEFVARAWIERDYERACWLALCDPTASDRPRDRAERGWIAQHWSDWQAAIPRLARSGRRHVVEHLARHGRDFRRALARFDQQERSLWLAAFQSHLWNGVLARVLRRTVRPRQLVSWPLKTGDILLYRELEDAERQRLLALRIPLPSARLAPPAGLVSDAMDQVLAEAGLDRRRLKVDYPRDSFFSKGDRAAVVVPQAMECRIADDELYPSKRKALVRFELPRGSYATMVIKRLSLVA